MTGLHALHMVVGLGLLAFLVPKALRDEFSAENHNRVEDVGLHCHIVDIVGMMIVVAKAMLVILFFLGVWHPARLNKSSPGRRSSYS